MDITLKNYAKILEDSDEYNVIINVGQEPDFEVFNAHSVVLRAQSPYFHTALSKEWRKEENGKILFEKPNVSPKVFDFILKYIYSGDISLDNFNYGELTDVIIAADEFILQELVTYIEKKLLLSSSNWLTKYFVKIYKCMLKHEFCKELQEFCNKKVSESPSIILKSEDSRFLDEEMMMTYLRLKDHSIKEVDVWNCVRKWGIAQNPTITFDESPMTWTEENFLILKETLSQCITLIKFSSFTSEELYNHVKPYKKIFHPEYYEDLLWNFISKLANQPEVRATESYYHNFPKIGVTPIPTISIPRQFVGAGTSSTSSNNFIHMGTSTSSTSSIHIDSEIIGSNHISLISRWINTRMSKSCESFRLLMNSRNEGFSSHEFSRNCDDIRSTLVILTVEGTNEILGGYNPLKWGSRGECWKQTEDSFIFSFPDGQDHTNYRFSYPLNDKKAIYRSGSNGPNFGGSDLTMGRQFSLKKDSVCIQTNYVSPIRNDSEYFRVESYEIFEVEFEGSDF